MFNSCAKAVQKLWSYCVKVMTLYAGCFHFSKQRVEKSSYTQLCAQFMFSFFHRLKVDFISVINSFSTIYTTLSINKTNLIKDY